MREPRTAPRPARWRPLHTFETTSAMAFNTHCLHSKADRAIATLCMEGVVYKSDEIPIQDPVSLPMYRTVPRTGQVW